MTKTNKAVDFLISYTDDTGKKKYMNDILNMYHDDKLYVEIDIEDMIGYDIYDTFIDTPDAAIQDLKYGAYTLLSGIHKKYAESNKEFIEVRFTNFPTIKPIRAINSENTERFIKVKGLVTSISHVSSLPLIATYKCKNDHLQTVRANNDITIKEPGMCKIEKCGSMKWDMVVKDTTFIDFQIVNIQELQNDIPTGKLPKMVGVFVIGKLVDMARIGDVIEISGIVRAEISKEIKLGIPVTSYQTRLYANNMSRLSSETETIDNLTEDEISEIRDIVKGDPDQVTDRLVASFAAHIKGHELIKESLILTMIGANTLELEDGSRVRGDINTFILGDPGTAKSEMGKATYRVAPKSFYASGKGSSAAGLTATVGQDPTTKSWMLYPGTTVLADKGLVVIDEFDKMKPEDRSALHEAMEQQQISINKATISTTLNTRTSIVAIANPLYAKYDPERELTENIPSVPVPLLTRFDLIFVVRDTPNPDKDLAIAEHIIATYDLDESTRGKIDTDLFAKYLRYAKLMKPKLSKEGIDTILSYYLEQRSKEMEDGFPMTVRQLHGLIRLTIARAKMLLKDTAGEYEAKKSIHLMDEMLKSTGAMDEQGNVDAGVYEGKSKKTRTLMHTFTDLMNQMGPKNSPGASEDDILSEMIKTEKWDEVTAKEFLQRMHREGLLFEPSSGNYALI